MKSESGRELLKALKWHALSWNQARSHIVCIGNRRVPHREEQGEASPEQAWRDHTLYSKEGRRLDDQRFFP